MNLPDFSEFGPFIELRRKMSADKLGHFELFDPRYHLTGIERSELEQIGLVVKSEALKRLLDFTLVFKNSRVILNDRQIFHISYCELFPRQSEYHIFTSAAGLPPGSQVCESCLQRLQFRGYDAHKARKEAYSKQVFVNFSLSDFWKRFPKYPISENREIRKNLAE